MDKIALLLITLLLQKSFSTKFLMMPYPVTGVYKTPCASLSLDFYFAITVCVTSSALISLDTECLYTLPKNLIVDKPLQELFSSVVTLQKYVNMLKMNDYSFPRAETLVQ